MVPAMASRHSHFNSHPHEEDDHPATRTSGLAIHFNSHPHEEDDDKRCVIFASAVKFQLTSSRGG